MSNPHPVCRFPPGVSGNPSGKPKGRRDTTTIMRALPRVRPLEEVRADKSSWRGTVWQMFESVFRDENNSLEVRFAAADRLKARPEEGLLHNLHLDRLTRDQQEDLARLLLLALREDAPPVIEHGPAHVLHGWSASGAPVVAPPPTPQQERDELLAKLSKYVPAEEIERIRSTWPNNE
jgi:hypothetical protein